MPKRQELDGVWTDKLTLTLQKKLGSAEFTDEVKRPTGLHNTSLETGGKMDLAREIAEHVRRMRFDGDSSVEPECRQGAHLGHLGGCDCRLFGRRRQGGGRSYG